MREKKGKSEKRRPVVVGIQVDFFFDVLSSVFWSSGKCLGDGKFRLDWEGRVREKERGSTTEQKE